jgi:hypothetical protein
MVGVSRWPRLEFYNNVSLGEAKGPGVSLLELEAECEQAGILAGPVPVLDFGQAANHAQAPKVSLYDFGAVEVCVVTIPYAKFMGRLIQDKGGLAGRECRRLYPFGPRCCLPLWNLTTQKLAR